MRVLFYCIGFFKKYIALIYCEVKYDLELQLHIFLSVSRSFVKQSAPFDMLPFYILKSQE